MLLALVSVSTSLVGCALAVRFLGLRPQHLKAAVGMFSESIGLAVAFTILNIGLATAVVIIVRTLGLSFVSAYVTGDPIWLVLSLSQAFLFQLWRLMPASDRQ